MTQKEKEKLLNDEWPKAYPNGKKAFLEAMKKASKSGLFDIEEEDKTSVSVK